MIVEEECLRHNHILRLLNSPLAHGCEGAAPDQLASNQNNLTNLNHQIPEQLAMSQNNMDECCLQLALGPRFSSLTRYDGIGYLS